MEQEDVIIKYHEGKTCHRGINETNNKLKRQYYFKNMKEIIMRFM